MIIFKNILAVQLELNLKLDFIAHNIQLFEKLKKNDEILNRDRKFRK